MRNFTNRHSVPGPPFADDDTGEHGQTDEPRRGRSTEARRPRPVLLYSAYGSSLLGSIQPHLCSLRRSTDDAQIRYSHAISSAIADHQGGMKRERSPPPSPIWEAGIAYANEEVAEQMARYREMFSHLSRLHAESLASSSLRRARGLVHRGQVALSAICCVGGQSQQAGRYPSPAMGHHARSSSEVSVWGWKPWRGTAIADAVCEGRKARVEQGRAERGEGHAGTGHEGDGGQGQGKWEQNAEIPLPLFQVGQASFPAGACVEESPRVRRRMTCCDLLDPGVPALSDTDSQGSGEESEAAPETPPQGPHLVPEHVFTDGSADLGLPLFTADGLPKPERGRRLRDDSSEISWKIPEYNTDVPLLSLPPPAEPVSPTTATVASGGDDFYRSQAIKEPSGMGTITSVGPIYSPEVSPKSSPPRRVSPPTFVKYVSGSSAPTTAPTTESSIQPSSGPTDTSPHALSPQDAPFLISKPPRRSRKTRGFGDSDSTLATTRSSATSSAPPMNRVRTAFKAFKNFPWSSSSEDERRQANNDVPTTSFRDGVPTNRIVHTSPSPRQTTTRRGRNPFSRSSIHNSPSMRSPLPDLSTEARASKVVLASAAPMAAGERPTGPVRHKETDKLTRTEEEYQELLTMLNQLKREMRATGGGGSR